MHNFFLKISLGFFLLIGCNNNEFRSKKKVDPEAIYFDYRVWGNEENSDVTVRLQYFIGDEEGQTVQWEHPAKVEFDGGELVADSSRMNGFYYEARIPLENFSGEHNIVFTDSNGKQYNEGFEFPVISLETEMPAVVKRKELVLELDGIVPGDITRLLLTDTSFYSRGIDRIDTARNDSVVVSPSDLDNLENGPVYMEIHKEDIRPLKMPGKGGGRLSLSYGLKRAFELRD